MTVYLDIIFIENICMNYIIIYATSILLKEKVNYVRIFFASALGAIYAVLSVLRAFEVYNSLILKVLVSALIVHIAVNPKNIKVLIKSILVFYIVTFTFGGIALGLIYLIQPENILMKNGVYIGTYAIKTVLIGGIIGYALIRIVFSIVKARHNKRNKMCEIEVVINDKKQFVTALIDSGNFLKEPITNIPAMVVEKEKLINIIPSEILNNLEDIIIRKN